jgi:hypothetical protein
MIGVLREKYGHGGPVKKGKFVMGKDLSAYKFLNKTKALSRDNLTLFDFTMSLIEDIQVSFKGVKLTNSKSENLPYKITKDLLHDVENFHENGFWNVVGGAKLYLLFDDLDLGWDPKDNNQQLLLNGLFSIIKEYLYRDRVKPLIALRTNILEGLDLPQREKFEGNILQVAWNKSQLEKMLILRLKTYHFLGDNDGFENLFVSKDLIVYMIKKTLYRPRDLLAFCKYVITDASKTGMDKIEEKNILAAESIYSKSRSDALADEWQYLYPKIDLLIKLLIAIKKQNNLSNPMSPNELLQILIEAKERILTNPDSYYNSLQWISSYFPDDNYPDEIVSILYKLGIVGFRDEEESGDFTFSYEYDEIPKVERNTKFQFHPMYESISTKNILLREENPWR